MLDYTSPAAQVRVAGRSKLKLLTPVPYVGVLVGGAFVGYWETFSYFAPYDDTGFYIHSMRLFNEGHTLYDQVFTGYGPFLYELWAAVFGLAGRTLTSNSGGLAFVGLWLLTSLVLGVSCQRLTGRLAIGVIVQVLSFAVLNTMALEPMNANGVAVALFALALAVLSFLLPRRPRAALLTLGALVAALLLTKINIGGFAAIAVAYATVMALPALRRVRPLRWLAAIALVAVGPVVMTRNLTDGWAQRYAILAAAGALAVVLAADLPERSGISHPEDARRWVMWLLSGFAACAVLVVGIVLALGTSLGAFVQETVIVPTKLIHGYTSPLHAGAGVVLFAVGMVAAALIVRRLRARSSGTHRPGPLGAFGRILVALTMWFSILDHSLNFELAISLAWVAAIPSTRDAGGPRGRFVRLLLPSLAVLQALMAYPVAGAQLRFGSLLFVVCGAVCFADGWHDLEAWEAARGTADGIHRVRTTMGVIAALLAIVLAVQYVARPIESSRDIYADNQHLPIAGASRLRLPAAQVTTFTDITRLLRARCRSVITLPGMFSFNLWSRLPAPSGIAAEHFWNLFTHSEEQTALASARVAPGLCAVRSDGLAAVWDNGRPLPQKPLVRFIEREFTPIAQYESYVVAVRRI
jgi:hypothetical protein